MTDKEKDKEWPDRLRKMRRRLRWTQEEGAHELGVSIGTLQAWEQGRNVPNPRLTAPRIVAWEEKAREAMRKARMEREQRKARTGREVEA